MVSLEEKQLSILRRRFYALCRWLRVKGLVLLDVAHVAVACWGILEGYYLVLLIDKAMLFDIAHGFEQRYCC